MARPRPDPSAGIDTELLLEQGWNTPFESEDPVRCVCECVCVSVSVTVSMRDVYKIYLHGMFAPEVVVCMCKSETALSLQSYGRVRLYRLSCAVARCLP